MVAILCDSGTKYLSKIFNNDWMAEKGFALPTAEVAEQWETYRVGSKGNTRII